MEVASEHRSGTESADNNKQTVNDNSMGQMKKMSFSNVVKASRYPKKDQAVVFPVVDGLQIKDYVVATGEIVNPQDMLFVSRMSNNRVCIYFSSKQIANDFVEKHTGITVNDVFIPARKLIMPAQRIIISNVQPCIPDPLIEEELRRIGLKLVSPVSFIGAGLGIDRFRHMCSFRRQVFIATDQQVEVPSSILIVHEEEAYRVFLSDDKVRCFRCKEEGHISSNCLVTVEPEISPASNKRAPPSASGPSDERSLEVNLSSQDSMHEEPTKEQSNQGPVNNQSSDVTILSDQVIQQSTSTATVTLVPESSTTIDASVSELRPAAKRLKVDAEDKKSDPYREIENLYQDGDPKPLDTINLVQFLNEVRGSNKPIQIARQYTFDIDGLLEQLKTVRVIVTDRPMKERCKRLTTSIKKALLQEGKPISSPIQSRSSSTSSLRVAPSQESLDSNDDTMSF